MTTHLGALINQQRALNGWSYAAIAARAAERGHQLSKANVGRLASEPTVLAAKSTIMALAAGLSVTPATVATAMLADMGIILTGQAEDTEIAIKTDPNLPYGGRRLLLVLLAEIKATAKEVEETTRKSPPGAWILAAPDEDEDL